MRPTRAPFLCRATARFTAVVDLPTPPFPAPTAMMLRMPGTAWRPKPPRALTSAVMVARAAVTPGRPRTIPSACAFMSSLTGQAGVVSSIVKSTSPPLILTSFTKPMVTMSLWRSGSWTARSAARTWSWETLTLVFFLGATRARSALDGQGLVDRLLQPVELVLGGAQDGEADETVGVDDERRREPLIASEGLRHVVVAQELTVGHAVLADEV